MHTGEHPKTIRKINKLLITIGTFTFAMNMVIGFTRNYSWQFMITHPSYLQILVATLVLVIFHKISISVLKILHVGLMCMTSAIALFLSADYFYGIGQFLLLVILLYRYELFRVQMKLKTGLLLLTYIVLIGLSSYQKGNKWFGLEILIYTAFFTLMLYTLYIEEIREYLRRNQALSGNLAKLTLEQLSLKQDISKFQARVKELDAEIQLITATAAERVNLEAYSLTSTEIRICLFLVEQRASNQEIADAFGIKERTVKSHLYNAFNKIGIDSRTELIGMFVD